MLGEREKYLLPLQSLKQHSLALMQTTKPVDLLLVFAAHFVVGAVAGGDFVFF